MVSNAPLWRRVYVLILSNLSPEPTCDFRSADLRYQLCRPKCRGASSKRIAISRFHAETCRTCYYNSDSMSLTAESVVHMLSPAPDFASISIRNFFLFDFISTSSASGTATVAAEVCTLPLSFLEHVALDGYHFRILAWQNTITFYMTTTFIPPSSTTVLQ